MVSSTIIVNAVRDVSFSGGVSNVVTSLTKEFQKADYRVITFTQKHTGLPLFKFKGLILSKLWLLFEIIWCATIGTIVLKLRFTGNRYIVISHNDFLYGDIYVNHGLHRAMLSHAGLLSKILKNPLHLLLLLREYVRHGLKIHKKIVCFSEQQKNEFIYYYPKCSDRVVVISNGVDLNRFSPEGPKFTFDGYSQANRYLIFVGKEFERKGLDTAIEALKYLPLEWQLLVVGGDHYQIDKTRRSLDDELRWRVHFFGFKNNVQDIYRISDCFILPAIFEPWGLVAIEALATGVPILMTRTGSVDVFLVEGVNGYFVERDAVDIAKKVNRLSRLDNKASILETSKRFGWEYIAAKYIELIGLLAKT